MIDNPEPCPCCGGEASVDFGTMETYCAEKEKREPSGCYEITCTLCGLSTGWKLDSINRWNRRVVKTTTQGRKS